jgi:hypothetical protein
VQKQLATYAAHVRKPLHRFYPSRCNDSVMISALQQGLLFAIAVHFCYTALNIYRNEAAYFPGVCCQTANSRPSSQVRMAAMLVLLTRSSRVLTWYYYLLLGLQYFACCCTWVSNFIPRPKVGTHIEGISKQSAEKKVWILECKFRG